MEQMIKKSREDTNKILAELKKEMQNLECPAWKQWESIEMFQTDIQEINKYDWRYRQLRAVSDLEFRVVINDQLKRDNLK